MITASEKLSLAVALCLILGLSDFGQATAKHKQKDLPAEAEKSADKVAFSDTESGYSIEFPAGWRTNRDLCVNQNNDLIVNLVAAPLESFKSPNPIPNVKIVVKTIPEGHTLDTISDTAIRQWSSIWKVELDEHSSQGKTPTRRLILVQTIPAGIDTSTLVWQRTKVLKAFAVSKSRYYIVSCAAFVDNFSNYQKTFTDIVNSLTLSNP